MNSAAPAHRAPGHRVAIIGAGFSGIAAAVALSRRGIDYVVFESAEGIGGTWWKNRYPGAEVDLESHVYSFSFERSDWTRTHAGWQELQRYLEDTAAKWGVTPRVRLNTKVEEVRWDEASATHTLRTADGDEHGPFVAVISAVGFLNIPAVPPFARGETAFEGDLCHTSTWPEGLSMAGRSVAVVGTGSSAVQIIQEAARAAREVKIFQLEPNWLLPKDAREFTPRERRLNRLAPVYAWRRLRLYLDYDLRQFRSGHARVGGRANTRRKQASLEFLRTSLAGHPELIEHATRTSPSRPGAPSSATPTTRPCSTRRSPWSRTASRSSPARASSMPTATSTTSTWSCWRPASTRPTTSATSGCTARVAARCTTTGRASPRRSSA